MMQRRFLKKGLYIFNLILFTVLQHTAHAQKFSSVQNYAINRPGVVMIKTVFSADVYVNKMKMDERNFNLVLDSLQSVDSSGVIYTAEQKLDIVLKQINDNPYRFFKATLDYIKQPEEITSNGTGFFITGDGYVATNCHLIDRDNAFIRRQFILSAFQQITNANITALESSWATTFTEQQRSVLYNTYASVYSRLFSMVLYNLKKDIYVVFSTDFNTGASSSLKKAATVVIKGQPMPGKDIAILKIDGDSALPTLKIADMELPRVGEQLFVYGYPGPVTNNNFIAQESAIEPTLTTGIVSAIKKSVQGWPIIQMDANINRGSSGGPVCNERGEVVGLTTFGSLENNGGLAAGLNFAIPVTILNEYLDTTAITPHLSKASIVFTKALIAYDKESYREALKKFEEVKLLNKNYPGLNTYIDNCKNFIQKAQSKKSTTLWYDLLGFAVLIAVVFILYLILKK
ncbi:MAG: trypsin-like peptidase domain-containing protein [Bacteroidetes bacterium]|nr:trypsin-like peptidase domain-containing protein [Bacteroidota bacterium]